LRVKLLFIVIVLKGPDFTTEEITSGPVLEARSEDGTTPKMWAILSILCT
jgi:hypothetical protein